MALSAFPDVPNTVHGAFGTEFSYEASADVLAGQAVAVTSGKIAPATSGAFIGIALYDIPAGTVGAVRVAGVARAVAGATVAAGAGVVASTLGSVATAGESATPSAIALEAGTEGALIAIAFR